jgi:hypothetical protein
LDDRSALGWDWQVLQSGWHLLQPGLHHDRFQLGSCLYRRRLRYGDAVPIQHVQPKGCSWGASNKQWRLLWPMLLLHHPHLRTGRDGEVWATEIKVPRCVLLFL